MWRAGCVETGIGLLLVLVLQSTVVDACGNATQYECLNGGTCTPQGCKCTAGYSGSSCENTTVSVTILVIVCILPIITWTIVCCYGCRSLHAKARRRRRRLQALASGYRSRQAPSGDEDSVPLDDDPPGYYQAVYSNPIAICSRDENPDWASHQVDEYLELPPHYDDLVFTIKTSSAVQPAQISAREVVSREGETVGGNSSSGTDGEVSGESISRSSPNQGSSEGEPSASASHEETAFRPGVDAEVGGEGTTSSASGQESSQDKPSSSKVDRDFSNEGLRGSPSSKGNATNRLSSASHLIETTSRSGAVDEIPMKGTARSPSSPGCSNGHRAASLEESQPSADAEVQRDSRGISGDESLSPTSLSETPDAQQIKSAPNAAQTDEDNSMSVVVK